MKTTWKQALSGERPLQVVGVMNAYVALMASELGYEALYLSGAAVANFSFGLPDLGMTSRDNVLEEVRRIRGVTHLPLLVDIDTGWGGPLNIALTIKKMEEAGASAVHIEDQVDTKRCGHREGKRLVSKGEMVDRIRAAVDARTDPHFLIMARTDAIHVEGLDKALDRAAAYADAGADMIFPEAVESLGQYKYFKEATELPILANMTEFGKTPYFSYEELAENRVDMALYPLTIARVMNRAGEEALQSLRTHKGQQKLLKNMQTRDELYQILKYEEYEEKL